MSDKDDRWLVSYIEHIAYEITGLITSYARMTAIDKYGELHPIGKTGEQNDCLDLMALHFRNLYEFFCYSPKEGYVRASSYVPKFKAETSSALSDKANNQVSHLTEKRHELAQDFSTKSWNPNDVMKWLINSLETWQAELDPKFNTALNNHISVIQSFLDWYKGQMDQGNI